MASWTRVAVAGRTHCSPCTTRATVLKLTPARVATSRIVGRAARRRSPGRFLGSAVGDTDDSLDDGRGTARAWYMAENRQRCQSFVDNGVRTWQHRPDPW